MALKMTPDILFARPGNDVDFFEAREIDDRRDGHDLVESEITAVDGSDASDGQFFREGAGATASDDEFTFLDLISSEEVRNLCGILFFVA